MKIILGKVAAAFGAAEASLLRFVPLNEQQCDPGSPAVDQVSLRDCEEKIKDIDGKERWLVRQTRSKPIAKKVHAWVILQRQWVTSNIKRAALFDHSLKRWPSG